MEFDDRFITARIRKADLDEALRLGADRFEVRKQSGWPDDVDEVYVEFGQSWPANPTPEEVGRRYTLMVDGISALFGEAGLHWEIAGNGVRVVNTVKMPGSSLPADTQLIVLDSIDALSQLPTSIGELSAYRQGDCIVVIESLAPDAWSVSTRPFLGQIGRMIKFGTLYDIEAHGTHAVKVIGEQDWRKAVRQVF